MKQPFCFSDLINSGLNLSPDSLNFKRVRIMNFILYLSVIINALLIKPNIDNGQVIYPICGSIVVVVSSFAILLLRRGTQYIKPVAHISLFVIYIILFPALYEGGIANSGFVWYFLLPLFAIFLLKRRAGLLWIVLMFATEIAALIFLDQQSLPYRKEFLFYHMLSLAVGTAFILFMQSIADLYEKNLKEQNEKLQQMAITDSLTQLYNRRHIDEQIASLFEQAKRFNRDYALILLDIDDFKMINDIYGHDVGDKVLINIAKLLQTTLRKIDFIGRWGGEEFLVICDSCKTEEASALAEKVRINLETKDFGLNEKVTASFGITSFNDHPSAQSLLKKVDQALYMAKEQGKNSIVSI